MEQLKISKFQEQIWLLHNLAKKSPAYNIATVYQVEGELDVVLIQDVFDELIKRYESLRTSFKLVDNEVVQEIAPPDEVKNKVSENSFNRLVEVSKNKIPQEVFECIHLPFNLQESSLVRIKAFNYLNVKYLVIVFHHIIVDLKSKDIFANDFSELYNSRKRGFNKNCIITNFQYSYFSKWHNDFRVSDEYLKRGDEWRNELPEANSLLNLPSDFDRPVFSELDGKRLYFEFSKRLSDEVDDYALKYLTKPFVILLASYAILLNKLSKQNLVVIGVPFTNRRHEDFKMSFGCCMNILPITIDFSKLTSTNDLKDYIRKQLLFAHRKQEIAFLDILNSGTEKRNFVYNPFYQVGFTFEHPMEMVLDGVKMNTIPVEKNGSQLDLFITLWHNGDNYSGYFEYATDLFQKNTIERYRDCFCKVVEQFTGDVIKLKSISILPFSDLVQLQKWNDTEAVIDTDICLHNRFEQSVQKYGDQIAISDNYRDYTYNDINHNANKLAHFLIDKGVVTEDIIGICFERSVEMVIAIFAIHKAGGAYLPLDPNNPTERLQMIVDDAKPKFILTLKSDSGHLIGYENVINIDGFIDSPLSNNYSNPDLIIPSNSLAYVMYTSGSTGIPKGVLIEHRSVINKLEWMQFQYPIGASDTLILKTSVSFDVSVWELFWWFFNGARLAILVHDGERYPNVIVDLIETKKVSTIIFVPSVFSTFLDYVKKKGIISKLKTLKYIIQIGEALSAQLVSSFNEIRSADFSPLMVNTYGPTEATVAVSYYNCPQVNPIQKIYIGKPIYNTKLFIVDTDLNIQPIGVPGELVIAGANLARGYLNRPDLNSEVFVNIKDLDGNDIRVYRTGDLVKWASNGELDFIGRVDNQVKIRGYRIELGEIETKILEHPEVIAVAVNILKSDIESQLVAYVVVKEVQKVSKDELKSYLTLILPDWMIPKHFMFLKQLPLNSNGKIDRRALPIPEILVESEVLEPETNFEKALSKIWCGLLNINKVGIYNNFFDIGGSSLIAIRMVSEIKDVLDIDIEPVAIMQYPNIKLLAEYISGMNNDDNKIDFKTRKRDFSRFKKREKY
ncbi:MAG: amino acid adenylation domain-containing protein [Marinilabiliaceae bacterium]|nr:amino acid adenylation domain-containing protein [Marinilabiliaceae bacterium]